MSSLPIAQIKAGKPSSSGRESVQIESLAASIAKVGLLQPIVVDTENNLIAGRRRLAALRQLGWENVPVRVAYDVTDAKLALIAERDENVERLDLTPSEIGEYGERLEEMERPQAEERKRESQAKPGQKIGSAQGGADSAPPTKQGKSVSETQKKKGKTRDIVAEAVGVSHDTYDKIKAVREAAKEDPEKFGDLPAKMDAESVNAAHKELKRRREPTTQEVNAKGEFPFGHNAPEEDAEPVEILAEGNVDGWGIPIQPHAQAAFEAVPKFLELLATIKKARKLFNEIAHGKGGEFLTIPQNGSYRVSGKDKDGNAIGRWHNDGLDRALRQIKNAIPTYTVCPYEFADVEHESQGQCRCCLGLKWTPVLDSSIPQICIDRAKDKHGVKEEAVV